MNYKPEPTADGELMPVTDPEPELMPAKDPEHAATSAPVSQSKSDQVCEPRTSVTERTLAGH